MKISKKNSAPAASFPVIVLGTKGTALVSCQRNAEGELSPLSNCHGREASFPFAKVKADGRPVVVAWKGKSEAASLGKALRAWVSRAGEAVRFLPLADALKSGAVVSVNFVSDGKPVSGYVPKGSENQRLQYVATETPGFAGRFETISLDKHASGRADNKRFHATLALPKTEEAKPAPAKKAAKKAAAVK